MQLCVCVILKEHKATSTKCINFFLAILLFVETGFNLKWKLWTDCKQS